MVRFLVAHASLCRNDNLYFICSRYTFVSQSTRTDGKTQHDLRHFECFDGGEMYREVFTISTILLSFRRLQGGRISISRDSSSLMPRSVGMTMVVL